MTHNQAQPAFRRRYEQLEHTADLALRIYGQDLRELFANAAFAMFSQLADIEHIGTSIIRQVAVEGVDYESLLVNWLNELLYLHDTKREVYASFDIHELVPYQLKATVRGDKNQEIHTVIKGATYHDLAIVQTAEGYTAIVIFDV
ncbi:MAG: archease [Anaerolineae bacterium]